MTPEQELFTSTGQAIEGATLGQLFGKPCFKTNGKAFVCFFENEMVFKLTGDNHSDALSLDGSKLFDPSGKGRAMKEWVQVPSEYKGSWEKFALSANAYVGQTKKA
ncbi:MAG: hypothetical protein AB8F78_12145 [Saprospiraceae bacterium]